MFQFNPSPSYKKSYQKIIKKNILLGKRIDKSLVLMAENPYHPSLKTHKVLTKNGIIAQSSWAAPDLRIIWQFDNDVIQVIDLLNIGSHDEVY